MVPRAILSTLVSITILAAPAGAQQPPPPAVDARVAAVKESFRASQAALLGYEWVETMVIAVKGETKARKLNRCSYDDYGHVEKVPVEDGQRAIMSLGALRDVVGQANTLQGLSASMQSAIDLVKEYVPPDPARIQIAKDAGKILVRPLDAGGVWIEVVDYFMAGDSMAVEVDGATNRPTGLTVTTFTAFTEKEKHRVSLRVAFKALADGTIYPANIQMDVTEDRLSVAIANDGYKKTS